MLTILRTADPWADTETRGICNDGAGLTRGMGCAMVLGMANTATRTLFHGSHDSALAAIESGRVFGGIFCSTERRIAESHGEHIYSCEIAEREIASTRDLNHCDDEDLAIIIATLDAECGSYSDEIWARIIDERHDGLDAEDSWDAQRIRGLVAAALGYEAIECEDEHGTSWLVLPGAALSAH